MAEGDVGVKLDLSLNGSVESGEKAQDVDVDQDTSTEEEVTVRELDEKNSGADTEKIHRLATTLLDVSKEESMGRGPEQVVDQSTIAEEASRLKEHDVIDEEIKQAGKVKEDLEKELEENDGWVKILGNDQLMKRVVHEGMPNKRPLRGEVCSVKIEGRLKDDENVVFEREDHFTFQLGDGEVISGLDLAIPLMNKGETSTITVAPRFGYGAKGLSPLVPPNAHLIYTIEVIDFDQEKDLDQLPLSKRRDIGNRKRERGNWWYGREEVTLAVQCYRRALEFLDEDQGGISYPKTDDPDEKTRFSEELRLLFDDRLKTYNNMAAAQLKLQAYGPALISVDNVLRCQPKNMKALFRKGKILAEKGDMEEAMEVFKEAVKLEPDNKAVIQELQKLSAKRKAERESEKLLYQRMFNTSTDGNSKSPTDSKSAFKKSFNLAVVAGGVIIALAGVMAYRYVS